jgi:hypothetical protein
MFVFKKYDRQNHVKFYDEISPSHMVLSIILLEDKHKILLHLSILYEYQQFFQHHICFSIQDTAATSTRKSK